jgi:hypothetical protein
MAQSLEPLLSRALGLKGQGRPENSDLSTNWTDVTNRPALNFTNLQYQVLVPTSAGNRFYRLKH